MKPIWAAGLLLLAAGSSRADTVLSEGFDNLSALPAAGWVQVNNSTLPTGAGWFQGNNGIFTAFSGAETSYAAANFTSTGNLLSGAVSDWLILPALTLDSSSVLSFMVRGGGEGLLDKLEVRFAPGSGTNVGTTSTSVGDFSILLGTYSADTLGGWEGLSFGLWGLSTPTTGRLAFRYVVDNVGTAGAYLGIDSVSVTATPVPEPATYLMMALGVAGIVLRRRLGA